MNYKQLLFLTALLALALVNNVSSAARNPEHDDNPVTTQLRIFQTLPNDPSEMSQTELSEMHRRVRATRAMIFGSPNATSTESNGTHELRPTLEIYTPAERREYLVAKGEYCRPADATYNDERNNKIILSRYDSLMDSNSNKNNDNNYQWSKGLERFATELWKYCLLYNGDGHVFLGYEEAHLLHPIESVLRDVNSNYGVVSLLQDGNRNDNNNHYLHDSFMAISQRNPAKVELSAMIRFLLETSNDVLALRPMLASNLNYQVVASNNTDALDIPSSWTLFESQCIDLAEDARPDGDMYQIEANIHPIFQISSSSRSLALSPKREGEARHPGQVVSSCPLSSGGFCCSVYFPDGASNSTAIALRHPVLTGVNFESSSNSFGLPYKLEATSKSKRGSLDYDLTPTEDLPYISTVRLLHNHTSTTSTTRHGDHSNFYDTLFENDCLPYTKQCQKCLSDVSNEKEMKKNLNFDGQQMDNACSKCHLECPCYCDILCKIRPLPKDVSRTYVINPPRYKKTVERLVPKIIHQTWFEPITKEKYPNFSRFIESWKKSGWEYNFYDDESAREFLSTHFPPEVGEAYDSIIPGAFKADLFRYCVLLIRGGVYADVDVLIETNLDDAIANDIGFMTPIDEPGVDVEHRSCLWNGFIATAPGHPFLARTIEIVVNNIRNRFTSVDYDDMLCPNPSLTLSHAFDVLFTSGPCILGAGINDVLGLHMQHQFEVGDLDIWLSERGQLESDGDVHVHSDDPRLLIPGRTIILEQNKNDMGAHRFTLAERHLIVAATDMPNYDDRKSTKKKHYSETHGKAGIYGTKMLYTNAKRANEEIRFVVRSV